MPDKRTTRSIDTALGNQLRAARTAAGRSMVEIARRTDITHQQIQKYECGVNRLSVARLLDIADAIGTPAAEILQRAVQEASGDTATAPSATRGVLELARAATGLPPEILAPLTQLARHLQEHAGAVTGAIAPLPATPIHLCEAGRA